VVAAFNTECVIDVVDPVFKEGMVDPNALIPGFSCIVENRLICFLSPIEGMMRWLLKTVTIACVLFSLCTWQAEIIMIIQKA
jgi:hypothetical protein